METIGVRALKARLSAHLKRVRAGASFTVTDRGRAIATLAPVDAPPDITWARRMVAGGQAHWNGGKPAGLHPRVKSRGKPASRMIIEDRR